MITSQVFVVVTDAILGEVLKQESALYDNPVIITEDLPTSVGLFDILAVDSRLYLDPSFPQYDSMIIAYGSADDLALCYTKGATDYIKSPWLLEELLFKVRYRTEGPVHCPEGGIVLEGRILRRKDLAITLTAQEAMLITYFIRCYGCTLPRTLLKRLVLRPPFCNVSSKSATRTIDMHITRLRKKLLQLSDSKLLLAIHSVYGSGYTFVAEECV